MTTHPNAENLSFNDIPPELKELSERILKKEPLYKTPVISFSQRPDTDQGFTLFSFLKPHLAPLSLSFLLVLIASLAQQAGPMITAYAIDHGIRLGDKHILLLCFLAYIFSIVLNIVISYFRIRFTGRLAQQLLYELRIKVFSQLQRLSLDFYTGEKTGRLLTRMTSDIEALGNLFTEGLVNLVMQAITLCVITIALFYLNSELSLVLLAVVVPVMLLSTVWFKNYSDTGYLIVRDKIADVMADLQENLAGYKTLITSNRRFLNVLQHLHIIDKYRLANTKMSVAQYSYDAGTGFVNIVGQTTILIYGYHLIQKDQLSIGELIAFQLFLSNFFTPLQSLVQLYNGFLSANAAVKKLSDLFSETISVPEQKNATHLENVTGDVQFKHVYFSYMSNMPVLKNFSFHLKPNSSIAFVGATGAGKSTVAKLMTRFYDPQSGEILLDGVDIKTLSFNSLRSHISVVPQEAFLFYGSIRDNLSFSNPNITDENIMQACELMGIKEFIEKFPQGLNTHIGERGSSLSAGERQLLTLARAFLSKPKILILDEATSNIDLASEAKVEAALNIVLENCSSIIIAHRLSTALRADKIAYINDGEIIEFGSHETLIKQQGAYAKFFSNWEKHT